MGETVLLEAHLAISIQGLSTGTTVVLTGACWFALQYTAATHLAARRRRFAMADRGGRDQQDDRAAGVATISRQGSVEATADPGGLGRSISPLSF